MCTQENTKLVSYRKNRNYTKHFEWTYKLNRDVYRCYTQARSDPETGYIKYLKKYWGEFHYDLSYFDEKQLRQQATVVEFKSLILETNPKNHDEHNQQQTSI